MPTLWIDDTVVKLIFFYEIKEKKQTKSENCRKTDFAKISIVHFP